jgi:hypothetical protein
VFLKENGAKVPNAVAARVKPFVDSGFVLFGTLPGPKHPLQNRWYNRCSKPDMAGLHSWIAFIDLDEFMVPLEQCASVAAVCVALSARSPVNVMSGMQEPYSGVRTLERSAHK